MNSLDAQSSPIKVRLVKRNIEVVGRVVHEDDSSEDLTVSSVSMRGAQREVTNHLAALGYKPATRWETATETEGAETYRVFRWQLQ